MLFRSTEEEFIESENIEITPNQLGQYPKGLHNIASLGKSFVIIDGKKKFFVPHKIFIYVIFKLKRFCKKKFL